jgi:YD repeat-containing protein
MMLTRRLDHLVEVTQPDPDGGGGLTSPVSTWEYDAAGQLLVATDALGRETTYEYDNLGRTTKVTQPDPDGGSSQLAAWTVYTYDAVGNVLTMTDRLSHTTTYAYDNLYRLTSVTNANSEETAYTYDAVGNRLTLTDPEDNTTTWTYDNLNRVLTDTNELSDSRSFEYDAVGNLVEKTDRLGRVTEYVYDNLYRRTSEVWKDGMSTVRTLSFTYDLAGQLLSASDPAADYDYVYDGLGRVTEIETDIDGLTPLISYAQAYNAVGNRTSLAVELGANDDFLNSYTYDNLQRLTSVTQETQSGGNTVASKRVDFAYNALGQFTDLDRYASLDTSEFVANTAFTYDLANRLTSLQHTQGLTALAGYDYTYDAAGRFTSIDSLLDGLTEYTHDNAGQLTDADHASITDEAYEYDDNGNRVMSGYVVGANNRISTDGVFDFEYDDEGNMVAKEEISSGERTEYEWDHRNRLVRIVSKDEFDAVTQVVEQTYDYQNRWVRSQIDADGDEDLIPSGFSRTMGIRSCSNSQATPPAIYPTVTCGARPWTRFSPTNPSLL